MTNFWIPFVSQVQPGEGVSVPSPVVDARGPAARIAPLLVLFAVVMLWLLLSVTSIDASDVTGGGGSGFLGTMRLVLLALAGLGGAAVYRYSDHIVNHPLLLRGTASLNAK
jgi:hypothetical protein